jgi:HAD superfamily hydrolase (TIGR01509 family)
MESSAISLRLSGQPSIRLKIEAVLFDLDGTLVATKKLYLEAYRRALASHIGRLVSDEEILTVGAHSERGTLMACIQGGDVDACHTLFHRHYDELHDALFEGVYDGIPELLSRLRERRLKTGIVTGKSRGAWLVTEARVDLGAFDVVVVEDDVRAPKPDSHGLELALEALGVPPSRAIYVGDSVSDMHAARAAGLTAVGVLWSKTGERRSEFALSARALGSFVVGSPAEVETLL